MKTKKFKTIFLKNLASTQSWFFIFYIENPYQVKWIKLSIPDLRPTKCDMILKQNMEMIKKKTPLKRTKKEEEEEANSKSTIEETVNHLEKWVFRRCYKKFSWPRDASCMALRCYITHSIYVSKIILEWTMVYSNTKKKSSSLLYCSYSSTYIYAARSTSDGYGVEDSSRMVSMADSCSSAPYLNFICM